MSAAVLAPADVRAPPRPLDIAVHCLHRGRVGRGTVRSRLPVPAGAWFCPAPRMPHANETLVLVSEAATRCAPWLRVYVGPDLWRVAEDDDDISAFPDTRRLGDGRLAYRLGGLAYASRRVVLVSARGPASRVLSVLHHEIWHSVENRLPPGALAAVDRMAAGGAPWPGGYLGSASERRARLYEHVASAWNEGLLLKFSEADTALLALWRVYSGGLAADVAAAAAPRGRRGLVRRLISAVV